MQDISLAKRIIYQYQGIMFWLIHWTDHFKILEIRISSLIRLLTLIVPVYMWVAGWPRYWIIIALLIFLWVQISYWRARRLGYYRFVKGKSDLMGAKDIAPLPRKNRVQVCASGTYSVKKWEKNLVLKPAEYWQVPLGDHVIMVEHEPGRYLYQFFNATTMQEINSGWLLFGINPQTAVAVKFLSIWGPEFDEENISLLSRGNQSPPTKVRTIYLSFNNKDEENKVWQNLVYDARRARLDQ